DRSGFNTLHLTRFSSYEKHFSWQVRTAIELEVSESPLILTAIEKEAAEAGEEMEEKGGDEMEERRRLQMHTAIEWME
ncbi:hypothetical protein PMAYCL1PPCAC_23997, partial [Pristionchus mayeri]